MLPTPNLNLTIDQQLMKQAQNEINLIAANGGAGLGAKSINNLNEVSYNSCRANDTLQPRAKLIEWSIEDMKKLSSTLKDSKKIFKSICTKTYCVEYLVNLIAPKSQRLKQSCSLLTLLQICLDLRQLGIIHLQP